jgi:hypothetical protein
MKLKTFKLIGILSLLTLTGWAQQSVVKAGLVKIYTTVNSAMYLGEATGWHITNGYGFDFLQVLNTYQFPDANVTFYLDSTGIQDYFLLALNAEKIGDCIKGKYVFKSSSLFDNRWPLLGLANAIRYGDALYVLGDETISDFSSLENLASAGKIRKINLKEKNEFCFYFLIDPINEGSSDFFIMTEKPSGNNGSWITIQNGRVVVKTGNVSEDFDISAICNFEYLQETIRDQSIVAQPTPVSWSKGNFSLSLAVTESGSFTATFDVTLPQKFDLDNSATKLAASLASSYELNITAKSDGVWSFEIKPKATRSGSANAFHEVINVAYTVDKSLEDGYYELKVNDLNLTLSDGTVIREEEIVVPVLFNSATSVEETVGVSSEIWSFAGKLYVNTSSATTLSIYTLTGVHVKRLSVGAGFTAIDLNNLPDGAYIVKGEGWTKKVIKN